MSDPYLDIPPVGAPRGARQHDQEPVQPDSEPMTANEPVSAPADEPLGPAPLSPDQLAQAEAALAAAQGECAELRDKVLRTAAEMENLRRRLERDREDAVKYAAGKFAKDILSVADNLGRALAAVPRDDTDPGLRNLVEGVAATEREMLNVFERHGIRRIQAEGQRFDPNLHQAMFEVADPTQPAGTVVQVVLPGYTLAERLLRPAMVAVAKGGPDAKVDTKA